MYHAISIVQIYNKANKNMTKMKAAKRALYP